MTDKFISPCSQPEGVKRELLDQLCEEPAEVIQRVCKALRFGLDEVQPGQHLTNEERILQELADQDAIVRTLKNLGMFSSISPERYEKWVSLKLVKIEKYLQSGSIKETQR